MEELALHTRTTAYDARAGARRPILVGWWDFL